MRKYLLTIAAALLSACGGGGSDQTVTAQSLQVQQPGCSVVLHGDSFVRGTYTDMTVTPYRDAALAENFAVALKRQLPAITVEDRSVPGQNMRNLYEGFTHPQLGYFPEFVLLDRRPFDVVVVENGNIDAWITARDGLSPIVESVDFDTRLRRIQGVIASEGKQMVITGFPQQVAFNEGPKQFITEGMLRERVAFNNRAKIVATELNVPFADFDSVFFEGGIDLADPVHPTQAYSSRLATRLAQTVAIACERMNKRTK